MVVIIILVILAAVAFLAYKLFFTQSETIVTTNYFSKKNDSIVKNKNGIFYIKEENKESMRKIDPYDMYIFWCSRWECPSAHLRLHSDYTFSMDIDLNVVKLRSPEDFEKRFADVKYDQLYIESYGKIVLFRQWDNEKGKYFEPKEYREYVESCKQKEREQNAGSSMMSTVDDGE